jgi:hypothetical protein
MSNAQRVGIEEAPANGAGPRGRRIAVAAGFALLLVSLGYLMGVRSSWTAHHPSVVGGMAERVPADVPYAYFDPEGGGRVGFLSAGPVGDVPHSMTRRRPPELPHLPRNARGSARGSAAGRAGARQHHDDRKL